MVTSKLVLGALTIEPCQASEGAPIELFWRGRSTDRHPSRTVVPYVVDILTIARQEGVPVRLHFETVEHMNSSTITAIIHIIHDARAREIPLVFSFDGRKMWQKLSFEALNVFVKEDKLFELMEEPGTA